MTTWGKDENEATPPCLFAVIWEKSLDRPRGDEVQNIKSKSDITFIIKTLSRGISELFLKCEKKQWKTIFLAKYCR